MDKKTNDKPRTMMEKRTFLLIIVFSGLMGALIYGYQDEEEKQDNYNKRAIEVSLERYDLLKKTEISDQLHDQIFTIIKDRKACYSSQVNYSERNNTCKRAYTNEIVRLARGEH